MLSTPRPPSTAQMADQAHRPQAVGARWVARLRLCVSRRRGAARRPRASSGRPPRGIEMRWTALAAPRCSISSSPPSEAAMCAVARLARRYPATRPAKVVDPDAGVEPLPRGTVGKLAVHRPHRLPLPGRSAPGALRERRLERTPATPSCKTRTAIFRYQARADDMIITAGYNVGAPGSRRRCLLQHSAVAECACDRQARRRARPWSSRRLWCCKRRPRAGLALRWSKTAARAT